MSFIDRSKEIKLKEQLSFDKFYCAFGGGVGRFGANFSIFSYKGTTIWIDIGAGFANQDFPGVQKTLPNRYLAEIFPPDVIILTHGHEDHIGAFTFFISTIPKKTCIVLSPFTHALLKNKLIECSIKNRDFKFKIINHNTTHKINEFDLSFFFMPHSILQTFSVGISIKSISKKVYFTSDFKTKGIESRFNLNDIKQYAPVDFLFCDSTGSLHYGESIDESQIIINLEKVIKSHHGRIFITTFSSHIERLRAIFSMGEKWGRKVSIIGLSLKNNLKAAFSVNEFLIPIEEIEPPRDHENNLLCLISGCQADKNSSLYRFSHGEFKNLKAKEGDLFIYSSSIIPGNEENVLKSLNKLSALGVRVVGLNHESEPLHASGHGKQGDILKIVSWLRPNKIIPVHGDPLHFYGFYEFLKPSSIEIVATDTIYSLNEKNLVKSIPLNIKNGFVENGNIHYDLSIFYERQTLAKEGICNIIFSKQYYKILTINYVGVSSPDFIASKKNIIFTEVEEKVKSLYLSKGKDEKKMLKLKEKVFQINQYHFRKRPYVNLILV